MENRLRRSRAVARVRDSPRERDHHAREVDLADELAIADDAGGGIAQAFAAVQYGMGEDSLAERIGKPVAYARELLTKHRDTYSQFWKWSEE